MSNNLEQNDELDNLNNDEKEELLGLEVDLLMQEDIEDFLKKLIQQMTDMMSLRTMMKTRKVVIIV